MSQRSKTIVQIVTSSILSGGALIVLCAWCLKYSDWQIREHLKVISPLFLELIFIGIVCTVGAALMIFVQQHSVRSLLASWSSPTTVALGGILIGVCCFLIWVVPRDHRIYYDEDIYENVAQNIALTKGGGLRHDDNFSRFFPGLTTRFIGSAGMCNEGRNQYGEYTCYRLEYNKEPNAWPHLLSVVYRIAGVNEPISFLTTNILFLVSILIVYWIGVLMFRSRPAGLYAAFMYALTPEVLIWSNTVAAEPAAATWAAVSVLSALLFVRFRQNILLFLYVLITAYAIQFRPESIMICIVTCLLFALEAPAEFRKLRLYVAFSFLFALIVPHCAHLFAVRSMTWGATGPKFSFDFFLSGNFRVNSLFYLLNLRFPLLFTVLFFLGLFLKSTDTSSHNIKPKFVIVVWFILFWGIFLFFYAGSYNYGADVRFSVLSAIPLALLAGNGANAINSIIARRIPRDIGHCIIALLILGTFISFMPFVRAISQEAWAARADHRYAQEMLPLIPDNAVVLTHNPNMFLVWGKNAAQASLATEQKAYFSGFFNRYSGGIFFHYNFWCNVNDPLQNSFCKNILSWYQCTPIATFREQNQEFALYRVERK
ncbi:MAG: hypothetical protein N3B18_10525 [Desulfobacterota bacterium]|nr:hypothetical protein [Thermodesulfobacteriota bacterium]